MKPPFAEEDRDGVASHPVRVRGLKQKVVDFVLQKHKVAPRAGAWVETEYAMDKSENPGVAPRAGAWVETSAMIDQP